MAACGEAQKERTPDARQRAMEYFQREVTRLERATSEDLAQVTPANWPETKQQWRAELREMLGIDPNLQKSELHVTTVGSIRRDRVRIDRLHYQSRPGLYVTANLYRPADAAPETGRPAVLYVCGHSRAIDRGRLMGNKTGYQHHGLWLARHGFVCLMIDTIQLGEFHGEHHGTYRLGRWDWVSRGFTPAGVEAWNAIRGIDLLCDLPDVDATKIGITGRSGGGAYSWFAAALDERIRVAIPVAGITDLRNHVIDGCVEGHCDCMYFANYYGWDYAKLAALVAPRPLLLENSDSDRIFPLDGVIRTDRLLRSLYAQLGVPEKYGLVVTPGPHKDTQDLQVPAFRWLIKHLQGEEAVINEAASKEVEPRQLAVFERETPSNERVTSVSQWFANQAEPIEDGVRAAQLWTTEWRPKLEQIGALPHDVSNLGFTLQTSGKTEAGSWQLFASDPSTEEGVQILKLEPSGNARSAVAHLGSQDLGQWKGETVHEMLDQDGVRARLDRLPDRIHYFIRPRSADWINNAGGVSEKHHVVRRFVLLGQTPAQVALRDSLAALRWISQTQLEELPLELAGSGREALVTVLLALLSDHYDSFSRIKRLHLGAFPTDAQLASCILGLRRVCHPASLRAAAVERLGIEALSETQSSEQTRPERLVDTASEPQQANGIRIVEVGQRQAQVWVRATRWPLPNLGDLPEVEFEKNNGKRSSGAILPETGVDGLRFAVPGVVAQVSVGYRKQGGSKWRRTPWRDVGRESDYSALIPLEGLQAGTKYVIRTYVRGQGASGDGRSLAGSFTTLPDPTRAAPFRLAVGTCQAFPDRDGAHGFDMYRTMLSRNTNAFVMAGDVVYYDRLARSNELAYYHWQRTYSLPTLVEFHRNVPTFFLKDDHDTYVNDSWPGQKFQWTDSFSFSDGQRIFSQMTGLPSPGYRTLRIGRDLQLWLMEGRDFRTPNNAPDNPSKSIWGEAQKKWFKKTLAESEARFKVVISPTPVVGPDRDNKKDNHANRVFESEGIEIRKLIAAQPNTVVVCGDRHWQFHSIDPVTGLHEFSVGPASDRHAGGWKQSDFRPEIHQFLRVGGGYLELELTQDDQAKLVLRHMDTSGHEHHQHVMH